MLKLLTLILGVFLISCVPYQLEIGPKGDPGPPGVGKIGL